MLVEDGYYPYFGYGAMSGPGMAVTTSSSDPSEGWNIGLLQAGYFVGGQFGLVEDDYKAPWWFGELGFTTPGISVTRYFVFKKRLDNPKKCP